MIDVMSLADAVLAGDVRAAARACRVADDELDGSVQLLDELDRRASPSWLLGVTGAPGVGKSSLVSEIVRNYRQRGERVAVIAVDPTSPRTGGAMLGDRIRMHRHFEDPGVFIRSVATRGQLGGLSKSTLGMSRILSAWGASVIVIETVGVGQSEIDVARSADSTLVVMAPGLGDEVQVAKAGLLEAADVFVVNKADRPQAQALRVLLQSMIEEGRLIEASDEVRSRQTLGHGHSASDRAPAGAADTDQWLVPVCSSVATKGEGLEAVISALEHHRQWLFSTEAGKLARVARRRERLTTFFREAVLAAAADSLQVGIEQATERVVSDGAPPFACCKKMGERVQKALSD